MIKATLKILALTLSITAVTIPNVSLGYPIVKDQPNHFFLLPQELGVAISKSAIRSSIEAKR
ncbi:hypothetical protein KUH03_28315 [Sphingobacterium sp. E70]|uniref:hypothetical protein n=1 Tax=Sphingobacterium sp. E70 TaxID=2853439 RepID=UPI00211CD5E4|nr:hypothetical protein [Sphingobacterium sp. E70]ULT23112.1 hypothetical protein KUH03_28315 [Sphingobacterium sp. E70]